MPFMAAAVPYMLAAGAAVSAVSAYSAGQQQKSAANYQAKEEANQAHIAADTAGSNAIAQQRSDRMQLGNAAALLAQSGGGFGGTGLEALRQSGVNAQLNEMNIQYGGQQQSTAFGNQSALSSSMASNYGTNGLLAATGSLFSGAGSIYRYMNNPAIAPANGG